MKHIFAYSELSVSHARVFKSFRVDFNMILQRRKAILLQQRVCYADFYSKAKVLTSDIVERESPELPWYSKRGLSSVEGN